MQLSPLDLTKHYTVKARIKARVEALAAIQKPSNVKDIDHKILLKKCTVRHAVCERTMGVIVAGPSPTHTSYVHFTTATEVLDCLLSDMVKTTTTRDQTLSTELDRALD